MIAPTGFFRPPGGANKYITYYILNEESELEADDEQTAEGTFITVDLWCKSDLYSFARDVKRLLRRNGFTILPGGMETYEESTQFYHKAIEIYIDYELEEL